MLMTEYETTMVVRPDIAGDAIEATLDRVREVVKTKGGKLLAIDHWGKKRLAYPIKKQSRGIYVHAVYLGVGDLVAEIERNLRISDKILRFLTVKVQDSVDPATREEKEYDTPKYDEPDQGEAAEAADGKFHAEFADEDAHGDDDPEGEISASDDDLDEPGKE